MSYRELLAGCGHRREKIITTPDHPTWEDLTTLDINPDCKPDVVYNLAAYSRMPFENNLFDELHFYEVLEHLHPQGAYGDFFNEFTEYWRILKPGGFLCASVPTYNGLWAWGDPGHRRVINEGTLVFLSQAAYAQHCGNGPMSDYRYLYKADFEKVWSETREESFFFVLRAIKPGRS